MTTNSWAASIAHDLGMPGEIKFKSLVNGRTEVHISCTACHKEFEIYLSKRLPPEGFRQKLRNQGWDTRPGKIRCTTCNSTNRRSSPKSESNQFEQLKADDPTPNAKMMANSTAITLIIPKSNELFKLFADEENKGMAHWSMEAI